MISSFLQQANTSACIWTCFTFQSAMRHRVLRPALPHLMILCYPSLISAFPEFVAPLVLVITIGFECHETTFLSVGNVPHMHPLMTDGSCNTLTVTSRLSKIIPAHENLQWLQGRCYGVLANGFTILQLYQWKFNQFSGLLPTAGMNSLCTEFRSAPDSSKLAESIECLM